PPADAEDGAEAYEPEAASGFSSQLQRVSQQLGQVGEQLGRAGQRAAHAVGATAVRYGDEGHDPHAEPAIPMGIPVEHDSQHARMASRIPLAPLRHTAVRAIWSVISFLLVAGVIVSLLGAVMLDYGCKDDLQAVVTACVACGAFLTFALRKTTLRRRPTFWQNTLRPFLLSLTMIGMGAPIVFMSTQGHVGDEAEMAAASATTVFGLLFIVLLVFARGRKPAPAAFLVDGLEGAPASGPVEQPDRSDPPADDQPAERPAT
ncbi:MAG: hypothetical protein GY842_14155, partial [bacterium]|nr:hypothetical protein [bacterium]